MTRFIDDYDCAMFDLDGVVYLGPEPVVGQYLGDGDTGDASTGDANVKT